MNLREIAAQNIYSKPFASAGLLNHSYFWYLYKNIKTHACRSWVSMKTLEMRYKNKFIILKMTIQKAQILEDFLCINVKNGIKKV